MRKVHGCTQLDASKSGAIQCDVEVVAGLARIESIGRSDVHLEAALRSIGQVDQSLVTRLFRRVDERRERLLDTRPHVRRRLSASNVENLGAQFCEPIACRLN